MNARLYDPVLGRFLSPDPFVQAPDWSQSFNRYSYCGNNPLMYVDENGELWFIPVITGLVGGAINMAATWNSADGFWEHMAAFGVGAAAGAAAPFTGGASFWTVAGVAAASGAVVGATNDVIAQTGRNFSGIGQINGWQTLTSAGVGGVSGFAGGSAGYWASTAPMVINGVNITSPLARSAIASFSSSAAGQVVGGTTAGLLQGKSLADAFGSSFEGFGANVAMGTVIGMATTAGVCYASGASPWSGRSFEGLRIQREATERGIYSAQSGLNPDSDIVNGYYEQMQNGSFPKNSGAAGYDFNGKITLTDGNHRMNAAIKYYLHTGNAAYINQLLSRGRIEYLNPKNYGLPTRKLPVK